MCSSDLSPPQQMSQRNQNRSPLSRDAKNKSNEGRIRKFNPDDGNRSIGNSFQTLPRTYKNLGILGMPDRYITKLQYNGLGNLTVPTTGTSVGGRYRPSSAYDVDPLLGSTATPYFSEFAAIYSSYRVVESRFVVKTTAQVNTSGQGVLMVITPLNLDPGASPSGATVNSWLEQPYAKKGMVGTAGSPELVLDQVMSTEKIFGSKMVYFDDNFSSSTAGIPTNNWYWGVGAIVATAPISALIVNVFLSVTMEVEFYNRKQLQS